MVLAMILVIFIDFIEILKNAKMCTNHWIAYVFYWKIWKIVKNYHFQGNLSSSSKNDEKWGLLGYWWAFVKNVPKKSFCKGKLRSISDDRNHMGPKSSRFRSKWGPFRSIYRKMWATETIDNAARKIDKIAQIQ